MRCSEREPLDPKQMYEEYARAAEQVAPFVHRYGGAAEQGPGRRPERHVRRSAGSAAGHRSRDVSVCHELQSSTAGGAVTGTGVGPTRIGTVIGGDQGLCHAGGRRSVPDRDFGRQPASCCARGVRSMGPLPGVRGAAGGWICPLLRYSNMINSTEWLVVTKMDVMDECAGDSGLHGLQDRRQGD